MIIAHRGGGGYAPENTISAIRRTAHRGSAQWIEFDVQRSSDGVLVLMHDANLDRTTNVRSIYPERQHLGIGEFAAAELARLECGSWFDLARFGGERIPTLSAALTAIGSDIGLMLELKNSKQFPGIEREVAAELRRSGWADSPRLQVWSFDIDVLERFHASLPSVPLGVFARAVRHVDLEANRRWLSAVGIWPEISEEDVALAHRHGLPIVATTLNSLTRMRRALDLGVDAIMTDFPDMLATVIAGNAPYGRTTSVIIEGVLGTGSDQTAIVRNIGADQISAEGWYFRHGSTTRIAVDGLLEPGGSLDVSFSPEPIATKSSGISPLALYNSTNDLVDVVELTS